MYTDVREDRLNNPEPSRVDLLALLAVNFGFHQINQVRLAGIDLEEKGESFKKFLSKIQKNLTDESSSQHRRAKGLFAALLSRPTCTDFVPRKCGLRSYFFQSSIFYDISFKLVEQSHVIFPFKCDQKNNQRLRTISPLFLNTCYIFLM